MIQAQVNRWKRRPKATRGELEDFVRAYLVENIPPKQRTIIRGGETFDEVEYILSDLDSYA